MSHGEVGSETPGRLSDLDVRAHGLPGFSDGQPLPISWGIWAKSSHILLMDQVLVPLRPAISSALLKAHAAVHGGSFIRFHVNR